MESIVEVSTFLALPKAILLHKEAMIQNRPVGTIEINQEFIRGRVEREALVGNFDSLTIARLVLKNLFIELFG